MDAYSTRTVQVHAKERELARARRRRGLSQAMLAGLVGRSESWLSQVERGKRGVDSHSLLMRLADVLRVDIEELTGSGDQDEIGRRADPDRRATRPEDRKRAAELRITRVSRCVVRGFRARASFNVGRLLLVASVGC